MKPSTAVIILNWNGENLLRRFLPSVVNSTPPHLADIFVADNGSTDNSLEILRNDFPSVKVLELGENFGFAKGYNLALEKTRYEFSVLLNSDVKVQEGWLSPLIDFMAKNPDVAAAMPPIHSFANPESFEYAGAAGGFLDRNGYPYCRGRIFDTIEKDEGQYASTIDVMWASGAALCVRTNIYLDLGGLDEHFFAHMEEIDLCWRMLRNGWRVVAVGYSSPRVFHLGGGSLPPGDPKKVYLNFRNNLLMMYKNLPPRRRRKVLFRRRLLDALAFLRFLVAGKFKSAKAIIRAHNDFRRMTPNHIDAAGPDLLEDRPDILVQYYLRGKKKFIR